MKVFETERIFRITRQETPNNIIQDTKKIQYFRIMKLRDLAVAALAITLMTACDDNTDTLGYTLTNEADQFEIITDTFEITTRSVVTDSVLGRTMYSYLGHMKDDETGTYVRSHYSTQFSMLEALSQIMPDEDSLSCYDENGELTADSCYLRLYFNSFDGDSINIMKFTAYELGKPVEEGTNYYTNFDPEAEGYLRDDGNQLVASKSYTLEGLIGEDSIQPVSIPLTMEYTDTEGNTYNNLGTYLLRRYYSDPTDFRNSYVFAHNVLPGFYIKSTGGLGTMSEVRITRIDYYYKALYNDSIVDYACTFSGTEEVMQTTTIEHDAESIQALADDNSCTYVKAPAGIVTEVTLPVADIMDGHEKDTLSSAKIVFTRLNNEDEEFSFDPPSYLLMIPKDSLYTFFENKDLPDNTVSFLASYSSSYNTYTFNNISTLITYLYQNQSDENEDWNKVVLIPVNVEINSSTSSVTNVTNEMKLKSARLIGGSENERDPLTISIIYNKFRTDD